MQKKTVAATGLGGFLALLLGIQAVPVARTNPPVQEDIPAPAPVKAILKASCYDCHSNETVWPWYSRVAPISWLVAHDTQEGRDRLNFSTWNIYDLEQQQALLQEALKKVKRGSMPPWYYTLKHTEGRVTADERAILETWATKFPN